MATKKTSKKPATKKTPAKKPIKPTLTKVTVTFQIGREKFKLESAADLSHSMIDSLTESLTAVPSVLEALRGRMLKRDQKRLMSTIKAWQKANPRPESEPTASVATGGAAIFEDANPVSYAAGGGTAESPPPPLEGDEPVNVEPDHEPTNEQWAGEGDVEKLKTVAAEGSVRGHIARRRLRELGEGAYVDSLGFTAP